ncbi:MAG: hypothetical protein KBB75_01955 [Candidatus Pacebacteria bacterium]|jgi:D-alanine-D-alanine ligase-like ATP-grasp enzyme|nr:hypothetical protein [Candidatus Paceibacterota bacterium]
MADTKKRECKDCGSSQVNHRLMYSSILIGACIEPWTNWMGKIFPEESLEWVGPVFVKIFVALGLGELRTHPSDDTNGRTRVLWEEAERRGIIMREFRLFGIGRDMFISNYRGDVRFFDSLPRPKKSNTQGLTWMDNKNEMKKHFSHVRIPVARGGITRSKKHALELFNTLTKPLITKPNLGSRSRHTRTHLSDERTFLDAFICAQQLSPWVMIEEELSGFVFRGTLIDKKCVAVLRREPASVTGDGVHTIRELVEIENKNPLRHGSIFHTLTLDTDAEKELLHWNKTPNSIPRFGEIIPIGQKTSRGCGGGITDVTDIIHKDNKELLEKAAHVVDDPIIGIDFIMDDITVSWKEQPRAGIIECNSAPFIDLHHFPLIGKPHNVAGKVWDIIYPLSSPHQS